MQTAGDRTERADPQCQAPERAAYRGLHPPPTGAGIRSKEALAMVAMELGHGDGRGRYVAQVYRLRGEG